ncbi:hypothetical protein [Sphingomonas sp. Mn802worker]|uniref:hypothetical protein n=1 Tax=Sphingomonas sp. Mn802worker TaxID=629773 RepID=UPI000367F444|nr:hypothetical protein [Sphingomonas sp. Mn802worker]
MFGDRSKQLSDMFAAQFTPHGSGFLYRRDHVGAGYMVTAAEREAFVAAYLRDWRRLFWGGIAGVIVLVGALVALFDEPAAGVTIAGTVSLIALLTLPYLRSWRRPERELARRMPSLPALDRHAARREKLARVTWGNLALAPMFALMLAMRGWRDGGVHGWDALWIVAGVVLIVFCVVQAVRKWRSERTG